MMSRLPRVIIDSHLRIPKDSIEKSLGLWRERFTLTSKYEESDRYQLFVDNDDGWFGIPLYAAGRDPASLARTVLDRRSTGVPISFKVTSSFRPGQREVYDKFISNLSHGMKGFVLEAKPGFGKTFSLIKMIEKLGTTTLVIVPRSNLVSQWVDRLLEHTDLKSGDIGVINGRDLRWTDRKIVVGLVHSVALLSDNHDRFGPGFQTYFGCVAYDEVDRSVPPATFAPVVAMMPSMYRIGCSATLKRGDGLEKIFEWHIGQCIIRGRDANRMKPAVIKHKYRGVSRHFPAGMPKMNRRGMLITALANDPARNMVIAKYISLIYKSGRRVLVLSDRTRQLSILRKLVEKVHGIPFEETGYFVSQLTMEDGSKRSITAAERERVASDCKVLFATYGMFSLGSDIQDLAGLVYATPQSDTKQSKGRIERECAGKKEPVIVDIVDTGYRDALGWASARDRLYRQEGLRVKTYG